MYYLALRTDKKEAEVYVLDNDKTIDQSIWFAHRQLAETIHTVIQNLLEKNKLTLADLNGIIFHESGESFTGLRIGASVANAMAAGLAVPVRGASGKHWLQEGFNKCHISDGLRTYVEPQYSSPAHITDPRK